MPEPAASHLRRAVAAAGAVVVAGLLALGGWLHVHGLDSAALALAQRQSSLTATRTARMIDFWVAERQGDASTLVELASIHGSDSTNISPAMAGRIIRLQMDALRRRGVYDGIWIVGDTGRVLGSVGNRTMSPAEDSAARRAVASGKMQLSRPEQFDSLATIAIASPIRELDHGVSRVGGAVVLRAQLDRALPAAGTPRISQAASAVVVVPDGNRSIGLGMCGTTLMHVCIVPVNDTLSRLALGRAQSIGTYHVDGQSVVVAAHRTASLPWAVYYSIDEHAALAPVQARLRFEILMLAAILLVAGLALYGYDRSVHLRELTDRAATEARVAAIVNTAEEMSEWQRRVLEAIATGAEMPDVLVTIAHFHEAQCPGTECAFHLIDDDGVMLRSAAAPSMRPEFIEAMDEIVVGPHSATCGTAVYRREAVITSDILTDKLWNDYRALALEQRYRSCWSMPIRSPQGHVLGALTMYRREPHTPSTPELRVSALATQLAGIAVDRARAAASLRQSEASFRSFVENSPIGIYRATGTGRLLAVNASLAQLLGYDSIAELLQVDMVALFITKVDRERLLRRLEAHGELRSAEMEWKRKDGTTLTVRVSARAYRDERGSVWFTEGFVENVTPLRSAESALRQSEKLVALGQLVSGVAHELNNPLAAILHFAEDLLDDERTAADLEALSVIRDQARRSRSIVRDLLSFVRFRDASRERVHLGDALAATVKALQPIVEGGGARLFAELPAAEVYASTDRAGLQQIVTNLVINAAQACGSGGTVHLVAEATEHELSIIVEDSGPGISPAVMDRIFEPFFTTKPLGEGTGLGLSVTLGIVQQLGGRIAVENGDGAERRGARFTVTLPIDAAPPAAAAGPSVDDQIPTVPAAAAEPAPRPRVLIIDDESSIRTALKRFFTRRGWDVNEAADGADGLSQLLATRLEYTVVMSDLKMPGCSGIELHDHVAALAPELLDRVIFTTGDVASREAAAFVQRTRCVVLQKPFELRALDAIISRIRNMASAGT